MFSMFGASQSALTLLEHEKRIHVDAFFVFINPHLVHTVAMSRKYDVRQLKRGKDPP